MLSRSSFKIPCALPAALLIAAFAFSVSPRAAAAAGTAYKAKRAAPVMHRGYYNYGGHRWSGTVPVGTPLPYGPEYGFLRTVPPNAIQMPGYTFVPGIGILGESCDLPTSACPNQYRDVK
jgi:hypothetical protein